MRSYGEAERFLADTIGLNSEVMGSRVIRSEVDSLLKAMGTDDLTLCLKELASDEEKMGGFIERIVVPETWFFRDREAFRYLKTLAGHADSLTRGRPLRILSAPCSTGEEPFSIAMTLVEAGLDPKAFRIDAVDISRVALKAAGDATYGRSSFRGETKYYEEKYFVSQGDRMRLDPRIAGLVHFHHGNILGNKFLSGREPYHIVFCKNFLIYLTPEARGILSSCLVRLLLPGGVLFTGHSELTSFLQWGYDAVAHSRSFACRRPASVPEAALPAPARQGSGRVRTGGRAHNTSGPVAVAALKKVAKVVERERPPETKQGPPKPSLNHIRELADRGSLGEASDLCAGYLKKNGAETEAHCLMGLIQHALNHQDLAEGSFQKALYLDPGCYEALLHMSLLYDRKGDYVRADIYRQRMKRLEDAEGGKERSP